MYPTSYHRASNVDEAGKLFAGGGESRYISGGQTLIPTMKQRLAAPSDLIDIARLSELRGITVTGTSVVIGAAMTHAEVAGAAEVSKAIPALADLAGMIGDPAVRHMGTIGGSVANNDPAADYPAAVLALGATVHTSRRAIPAGEYFKGLFTTALEDGEIIVRVEFPIPARAAYQKFRNPASRYAMAGVFVAVMKNGEIRVGVTGAGSEGVFRSTDLEKALTASWSPSSCEHVTIDPSGLLSDIHASAEYRANLVKVMAKRAVAAAG